MEVLNFENLHISEDCVKYEGASYFYLYRGKYGGVYAVREYIDDESDDIKMESRIFSRLSLAIAWIEELEI